MDALRRAQQLKSATGRQLSYKDRQLLRAINHLQSSEDEDVKTLLSGFDMLANQITEERNRLQSLLFYLGTINAHLDSKLNTYVEFYFEATRSSLAIIGISLGRAREKALETMCKKTCLYIRAISRAEAA